MGGVGEGVPAAAVQSREIARIGAQRRARLNLDIPTLKDIPLSEPAPEFVSGVAPSKLQLSLKITRYEDGLRCVGYRMKPANGSMSVMGLSAGSAGSSSLDKAAVSDGTRAASSIARSRSLVTHRARCLGARYLWTFTKRGKFVTSDEVWTAWKRFSRLFDVRFGRRMRYVAVPELHGDGETWHLHVAFGEWFDVVTLRVLWYRALGGRGNERADETPGSVNAKDKKFRSGRSSARRVAGYIAKYVGKGFERGGANRRVFAASSGLRPLELARWHAPFDGGLEELAFAALRWVGEAFGLEYCDCWFDRGSLMDLFVLQF